jgi:hypothetical protein
MGANRRVILGGSAGATLAILAGRLTYELDGGGEICGDSPCGMIAGITTTLLLEPFLLPAGVHLANRRWGSFGGAFFASLAAGAATLWMGPGVITTRWYC